VTRRDGDIATQTKKRNRLEDGEDAVAARGVNPTLVDVSRDASPVFLDD
jgi:hypothetical protein